VLFTDSARTSSVASPFSEAWALAVALSTLTMLSHALFLAAKNAVEVHVYGVGE
jgi:hypothetical protein